MDENYVEYAVPVRQTSRMRMERAVLFFLTAASFFLAFAVHWVFFLLSAVGIAGCYFAYLGADMEYEAIYTDGTLEISAIYRKMKRKRKFLCEMKEATGYHIGKKEEAVRLGTVTKDFSSHREGCICCVMKVGTPKGSHVICFEPGEELAKILEARYRVLKV